MISREQSDNIGKLLFKQRKESFEKILDAICEEIVSTNYCNQLLTGDFRFRVLKNMEYFIEIYLNSEREVFLSTILNKFMEINPNAVIDKQVIFENSDSKLWNSINSNENIRKAVISFSLNPKFAESLSTTNLVQHFFFEASMIKSYSLQMRTILFDFSQQFLKEINLFKLQVKNAILHIVQQCHILINSASQHKDNTDSNEVEKLNDLIIKMETSHSETEKALKAEIEQLKIHSLDSSKSVDLEKEIQIQKEKNNQLVKEVLEKTEKLRVFYAIKADLEEKTEEAETWKRKYEELEMKLNENDPNSKESYEKLSKENKDLQSTNSTLAQENANYKKTISDKNSILKQSLACIEKLQQNIQNKDLEINSLKEQLNEQFSNNETNNSNNAKLISIIEKQKKQISKLNADNEKQNSQIAELKKELEENQEKFTKFAKIAETQIKEANNFARQQLEEAQQHANNTEEEDLQKNDENETNKRKVPSEIEMKAIAEAIKLKAANSDLIAKNYVLQTKIEEHIAQKKKLASSFSRAKEDIKEVKELLQVRTNELATANQTIEELKNDNKEKVDENIKLTSSIRKLMQQREIKDEKIKQISVLQEQKASLEQTIKQMTEENESQRQVITNLKIEIDPLNQQVLSLRNQLNNAKSEISSLQAAKREIQMKMSNEQNELVELNSGLKNQVEQLRNRIDSLQKEKHRSESLLKETMDEYEKEMKNLTAHQEETRISSEQIINSLDVHNKKLQNDLEIEKNNTKLEKMKVKEALKQIESISLQMKAEVTKRQKQNEVMNVLKDELNEFQADFKQISFAIFQESTNRPASEIIQEIRRLRTLLDQLTDANLKQANMNDALKNKLECEKGKQKAYAEKLTDVKQELKNARQSKSDTEKSLQIKIDELQEKIRTNEKQYQIALMKMQNQFAQQIQSMQSDLSEEVHQKEEVIKKYDEARSLNYQLQQEFEKSQMTIKDLQNGTEDLKNEKNIILEQLKSVKDSKSNITARLEQLQENYQKADLNNQEIIVKNAAMSNVINQMQSMLSVSSFEEIPSIVEKMKADGEISQRFMRNAHKIMDFADEADFFVKLNMLLTQKEGIEKVMNENAAFAESARFDVVSGIKEMAACQSTLSALKKQNHELEQKMSKMVPSTQMDDANMILSKIMKIITGEDSEQLKFPMKSAVSVQLLELIKAYQTKNEKNQKHINYVFAKAKEAGYSGKNFARAFDCLTNNQTSHNENNERNVI